MTFLQKALRLLVLVLLLMGVFSGDPLNALTVKPEATLDNLTEVPSSPPASQSELSPKLRKLFSKTKTSFDQAFATTQQAIADLPRQLETLATSTDKTARQEIKKILEEKQDDLENAADKFDDLSESLVSLQGKTPELLLAASQARDSLDRLAQSINQLADTTEGLKSKSNVQENFFVQEQVEKIQGYLQQARQNLENLLRPTPAT